MFLFEKDMSFRLLSAGRKRLPDKAARSKIPGCAYDWNDFIQTIVLGMVRRGEFNAAVEKLAQMLMEIYTENHYDLNLDSPDHTKSTVESLVIVLESLNVAFTENLIMLGLIPRDPIGNSQFLPLRSIVQWGMIRSIPPLDESVAETILTFGKKVMPKGLIDTPVSSSVALSSDYILADSIISVCQYIYASNPSLILAGMKRALKDAVHSDRVELLGLCSPNGDAYAQYMRLVRRALPKLNTKGQTQLMLLVCGGLCKGILSNPSLTFADNEDARRSAASLYQWIDKLRAFRPLRVMRCHEAVIMSVIELQDMVHKGATLGSTTASPVTTPTDAYSINSGEQLLSLSETKVFERTKAVLKRHNNEKRSTGRIAAAQYMTILGFLGWASSQRPGGRIFYGLVQDILPFIPDILEIFDAISRKCKVLFLCVCADVYKPVYFQLLPNLDSGLFFEVVRSLQAVARPETLCDILNESCDQYMVSLRDLISWNSRIDACATLDMLVQIPAEHIPVKLTKKVLEILCTFIANHPDSPTDFNKQVYEVCIERIYKTLSSQEGILETLSPLLPSGSPISNYHKVYKVRSLYHYLKLVASGRAVIPAKDLESGKLNEEMLREVRMFLMLCLCVEESVDVAPTALKCLELMQGDPYQSATQRDLVSMLLDSMENSAPSIVNMQAKMASYLANTVDQSFSQFNQVISKALEHFHETPLTFVTQTNLLMMKAATLALEPKSQREEFYYSAFVLSDSVLISLSKTNPELSVNVTKEYFGAASKYLNELLVMGVPKGPKISGKAALFKWLIKLLSPAHPLPSTDLKLGEICSSFIQCLNDATSYQEQAVLRLVELAAKYVANDTPHGDMKVFDATIQLIMKRDWLPESEDMLKAALVTIFENYKATNDNDLLNLKIQIANFSKGEDKTIELITPLLRKNIQNVMHLCNNPLSLNHISRACSYDALAQELSAEVDHRNALFDKTELVLFLSKHIPILETFCDVCSMAGNDTLWSALLELFSSYSQSAERDLIAIALNHEVNRSSGYTDMFRSNSITMKIILEWFRITAGDYLQYVLSPVLGSLRSASLFNDGDVVSIFGDSFSRYESKALPDKIHWFLRLAKEKLMQKFDEGVAQSAIENLLSVRIICPAVLAPNKYGITSRAPAREFSKVLRKYAIFLQNRKEELREAMMKQTGPNINEYDTADDIELKFFSDDNTDARLRIESMDQYTSATRHVFHLLRRHAVEIRVVMLSRGYSGLVFSMMRYLRLGKTLRANELETENELPDQDFCGTFRGQEVLIVSAQDLCKDAGVPKHIANKLHSHLSPLMIDFTDFIGISDLWSDCLATLAFGFMQETPKKLHLIALNCPRAAITSFTKISAVLSLSVHTEFISSFDLKDEIETIPSTFSYARTAAADINCAVGFEVKIKDQMTSLAYEGTFYVGAQFLQLKMSNAYEVLPFVKSSEHPSAPLVINSRATELSVSCGGLEMVIENPSPALKRMMKFSLDASQAASHGACIDLGVGDMTEGSVSMESLDINNDNNSTKAESSSLSSRSVRNRMDIDDEDTPDLNDIISPGNILFSTILDMLHPLESVRSRAIQLYATLHDTLDLTLNVSNPRESVKPSQVYSLALAAANRRPGLAISVATSLAFLGENISEAAVRVASPWISHIVLRTPKHTRFFRSHVIKPLLNAIRASPKTIGPPLLEYFWPNLHDMPNIAADLLLDAMKNATPDITEAIRQIAALGIPHTRPHEAQQLAEVTLARLYASLRSPERMYMTKYSDHTDWEDIYNCALLFGSIVVDYQTAEALFPDMGFVLLVLARVGDFKLRNTIHEMLINYVNSFLQTPHLTASQGQRLRSIRSELNTPRCLEIFGINKTEGIILDDMSDDSSDNWLEFSSEMSDFLGRLLWEIVIGVFGSQLTKYQEARAGVASRILEFIEVLWPPLQRRCILGIIGTVKFFMPERVVAKLLDILRQILSFRGTELLHTQAELVNAMMRMFSETIECIPETGTYQKHLFWLAVVALATGIVPIQANAVLLLKECVKIEHFRGAFQEAALAEVFLEAKPDWIDEIKKYLPLSMPTSAHNFHPALAQLLLTPLQKPDSEPAVLECLDVLATACPSEILYVIFIFMGGKNHWLIPRVPSGILAAGDDTVLEWLANKMKYDDPLTLLSLGYTAYISAYSESADFAEVAKRALNLIERVQSRRVVYLVAPLLRPAFVRLLELEDPDLDVKLVEWSSCIFSLTAEERQVIKNESHSLINLVNIFGLKLCFDENSQLVPLAASPELTRSARLSLGYHKWATALSADAERPYDGDQLF